MYAFILELPAEMTSSSVLGDFATSNFSSTSSSSLFSIFDQHKSCSCDSFLLFILFPPLIQSVRTDALLSTHFFLCIPPCSTCFRHTRHPQRRASASALIRAPFYSSADLPFETCRIFFPDRTDYFDLFQTGFTLHHLLHTNCSEGLAPLHPNSPLRAG